MHAIKCLDNEAMRSFKEFEKKLSFIGEGKRMVSWSSDEVHSQGKVERIEKEPTAQKFANSN